MPSVRNEQIRPNAPALLVFDDRSALPHGYEVELTAARDVAQAALPESTELGERWGPAQR
jgi:hypothetical protein